MERVSSHGQKIGQYLRAMLCTGAVVSAQLWAQTAPPTGRFLALGESLDTRSQQQVLEQGRIFFYRPQSEAKDNAVSIYVNDRYHASLEAGAHATLCMQPTSAVRLGVRKAQVGQAPQDTLDSRSSVDLPRGQTLYVRVSQNSAGSASLSIIPDSQALKELEGSRQQIHTISRLPESQPCRLGQAPATQPVVTAAVAPVPAPAPERFVVSGDALFRYARSDASGLAAGGQAELDRLVARLRQNYAEIDRLSVIGYTDPLGRRHETISRQRAETVMAYLMSHGIRARQLQSEGRGASDLVIHTCGNQPTPQTIACNQPNRRVVIEVSGVRR